MGFKDSTVTWQCWVSKDESFRHYHIIWSQNYFPCDGYLNLKLEHKPNIVWRSIFTTKRVSGENRSAEEDWI